MSAAVDNGFGPCSADRKQSKCPEELTIDGSETTAGENASAYNGTKVPTQHRVADILKEKLKDETSCDQSSDYYPRQPLFSPSRLLSPPNTKLVNGASAADDINRPHPLESLESSKVLRGILQGAERHLLNSERSASLRNTSDNNNDTSPMSKLLKQERELEERMRRSEGEFGMGGGSDSEGDGDSMPCGSPCDMQFTDDSDHDQSMTNIQDSVRLSSPRFDEDDEDEDENYQHHDNEDSLCSTGEEDCADMKRARVETIVNSMRTSPNKVSPDGINSHSEIKRPKRKQYIPQQHGTLDDPPSKIARLHEKDELHMQLKMMQDQLAAMQQRYTQLLVQPSFDNLPQECESTKKTDETSPSEDTETPAAHKSTFLDSVNVDTSTFVRNCNKTMRDTFCAASLQHSPLGGSTPADLESLAKMLKTELTHSVGTLVDTVVAKLAEKQKEKQISVVSPASSHKHVSPSASKPNKKETPPSPESTTNNSHQKEKPMASPHPRPHESSRTPPASFPTTTATSTTSSTTGMKSPVAAEAADRHGNFMNNNKPPRTKVTDKFCHPLFEAHLKALAEMPRPPHLPLFPTPYFPTQGLHHVPPPPMYGAKEPEQTEALPLVVNTPKKKRTKVTDTRLSPRAARALLQEGLGHNHHHHHHHQQPHHPHHPHHSPHGEFPHHKPRPHSAGHMGADDSPSMGAFHAPPPLVPASLPTSVAIPNPSLQHSDVLAMYSHGEHHMFSDSRLLRGPPHSPGGSPVMANTPDGHPLGMGKPGDCEAYDSLMGMDSTHTYDGHPMTSTLTPMHLRKAKLMFFYTRYPSSSVLKIYFPDVRFNKNNTAQLVKWFSNFREFFYIQMEKYARQALAEGVKATDDIIVSVDSELYRVLNLHYNRNNQIEVPENFRITVQAALREFFKSISMGKDQEQSWKKAIYKIIARLDDSIPEYFKSPNWMEQLNDAC